MSFKRVLALLCAVVVGCAALTGCGKKATEQWAYIHDTETPALSFYEDGSASFNKAKYTSYEITDKVIRLTDKKGDVTEYEYYDDGETRYVYDDVTYDYSMGEDSSQLIGVWTRGESSYQFTDKGTFMEDGVFPGYYRVQDDGTIRLIYNDPFQDTILKYRLEGGKLIINYPWPMIKMGAK